MKKELSDLLFAGNDLNSGTLTKDDLTENGYRVTCYISSIQMAEFITATVTLNDSFIAHKYRVSDYLSALTGTLKETEKELAALVNAIRDYGHYAQIALSNFNGW